MRVRQEASQSVGGELRVRQLSTDGATSWWSYEYTDTQGVEDPFGALRAVSGPAGDLYSYTYDSQGRVDVEHRLDVDVAVDTDYLPDGALDTVTSTTAQTTKSRMHYTYDDLGRVEELRDTTR